MVDCAIKMIGDREYVYAQTREAVTSQAMATFQKRASELAGPHGLLLFLFDVRGCADEIGTMDTIEVVEAWKEGLPAFARIAVLVSDDDTSYDFFETAAQNRSLTVKCFVKQDDALNWLLS